MRTKRKLTWMTMTALLLAQITGAVKVTLPVAQAAEGRFVVAETQTQDVTQVWTSTGTVSREGTESLGFTASGTVKSIKVAVGDTVEAGDTLATLETLELKQEVAQKKASLLQAKASLYTIEHPTSYKVPVSTGGSSGGQGGNTPSSGGDSSNTDNTKVLTEVSKAITALEKANTEEATLCATPDPTTGADTAECIAAKTELQNAISALIAMQKSLGSSSSSTSKTSTTSSSAKKASTPTVKYKWVTPAINKPQQARAKAQVLQAQQQYDAAKKALAQASLKAEVAGVVGEITLVEGTDASSGTVTIISDDPVVEVSTTVPLSTRKQLDVGDTAIVTAGVTNKQLTGTITRISPLDTTVYEFFSWEGPWGSGSSTDGDPSYPMTITLEDPEALLTDGTTVAVSVEVAKASGAVVIPASALTPTNTTTGTVQVVASPDATEAQDVPVSYGVIGGGYVEITEGLSLGEYVVLADREQALESNEGGVRI
ncbi:MAG: biotin/lipoyl-binding protein [Propionibacteriaceae bacterium]|jgi:multidrug efflux pump subunit AcrA (membrane-fusion protein)|nr:biotin/lipoyl-binding protein [Propionibacteriaceae bacterium]